MRVDGLLEARRKDAAVQITSSPVRAVLWSTIFAEVAAVGGLILSLAPGLPVSVFVTMISFRISSESGSPSSFSG